MLAVIPTCRRTLRAEVIESSDCVHRPDRRPGLSSRLEGLPPGASVSPGADGWFPFVSIGLRRESTGVLQAGQSLRLSAKRQHYVPSEAEALPEARMPSFERRQRRPLDACQCKPAVHGRAHRNVAHREVRARYVLMRGQMAVEDGAGAVRFFRGL